MDERTDDLNEIDSTLILSLGLENLNLEDIFEEPDDISKYNEYRDPKNILFLPDDAKLNKSSNTAVFADFENSTSETSVSDTLPSTVKTDPNILEKKKDINGNEDLLADENFNNLLHHLNLIDSESETEELQDSLKEQNKDSSLIEKGPISRKQSSKNQKQTPYSRNEHDINQFNSESLKFLSGSSYVQVIDTKESSHGSVQYNSVCVTEKINCLNPELVNDDQFYDTLTTSISVDVHNQNKVVVPVCDIINSYNEDNNQFDDLITRSTVTSKNCSQNKVDIPDCVTSDSYKEDSVSSPESGYGTSITGSPPQRLSLSPIPDFDSSVENIDEEVILEELADIVPTNCGPSVFSNFFNDQEKILKYLKATENEYEAKIVDVISSKNKENELSNITSDVTSHCISGINNVIDLTRLSSVTPESVCSIDSSYLSPLASESLFSDSSRNGETRIACKPVNDKAKNTLQAVLCDLKSDAMKEKILKSVNKQIAEDLVKKEDVKVIYVIDETDNRTNLHNAILNNELEEVYYLVEIHKKYKLPFSDLSPRDKNGRTPLDYAVKKGMTLVVEYLMENNCCQGVKV